jgi:2-methylcitrate dehydratase PrpD
MTALHELARRLAAREDGGETVGARTLDALGALLAGSATDEGREIAASLRGWDDGVPAAIVRRVALVRMTELDDIHMPSCTTPGAVVVPTAVTLGAALDLEPTAYRRAVVLGYEAMTRLGGAIGGARVVYRGVWPTYFCAPFAAAAVAAAMLELDEPRVASALGIALTRSTGLTAEIGGAPLARWLTVGDAARAGCAAAFAARDGFVADVDLDRVAAGAGIELEIDALRNDAPPAVDEVSVKPFPTAKQSLAAVEAARRLTDRAQVGGPIRVHVPDAYASMVRSAPRADSRLSRLSSAGWNVALALRRPEELHDVERALTPEDPELAHVAANVEIVADPELSRLYPARWAARVEIAGNVETVVDTTGDPSRGNGLDAVEAKWAPRPEQLEPLREAALAADVGRLAGLLDKPR